MINLSRRSTAYPRSCWGIVNNKASRFERLERTSHRQKKSGLLHATVASPRISASLSPPPPPPPPRCRCHRMRAKRGRSFPLSGASLVLALSTVSSLRPSSLRALPPPPRVILKRGQLAVGEGGREEGCWKGMAAGDDIESRGWWGCLGYDWLSDGG